jgi:transposase-like protein
LELTPEERKRIYEEEKARLEAQERLKQEALDRVTSVAVTCPRCHEHTVHPTRPSHSSVDCAHCGGQFDVSIGRLVGGTATRVMGNVIGTYNDNWHMRIEGLDGVQTTWTVEVSGVGHDFSGGDILSLSILKGKPRVVTNSSTKKFTTLVTGGCVLTLLSLTLLSVLMGLFWLIM